MTRTGQVPAMTDGTRRRFALASPRTATALGAVVLALVVLSIPLARMVDQLTIPAEGVVAAQVLTSAVVGVVVAYHRPRNPVGWILACSMLLIMLSVDAGYYAVLYYRLGHPGLPFAPVAVLLVPLWVPGAALFALVILLFPDGRLTSPRWRWVLWAYAGLFACFMTFAFARTVAAITGHRIRLDPAGDVASTQHPPTWLGVTVVLPISVIWLSFAVHQVLSWRRATGERRQQLKWLAFGAAVTLGVGVVGYSLLAGAVGQVLGAAIVALPISIGIGILKYRLYDIDVVISRTIVYGSLAAFITVVYVVIVAGIGSLGSGSIATGSRPSLGLSIVATAVVAVAFHPVRERMQRLANRLVYGRRATPYEALSEFAGRMGGTYAADDVLPRMARTLAEGTGASRVVVWLKDGDELVAGARWPAETGPAQQLAPVALADGELPVIAGAARVALVPYQGKTLGALSISKRAGETLTPVEGKLMSDLAAQAGLLLHNIGLTQQLQARLTELQASRLRIVTAADDQRRRIERDIHDGAQQQLLAIGAKLAFTESVAGQDEGRERALLAQLKAETSGALETLRELARGVYPPLLADQGLAAAIRAQAGKAPGPVEVDAGDVGRYPPEIETAIYFCCVEALQNAARHAPGSAVRVSLAGAGSGVAFTIADDGPGFEPAAVTDGTGLRNMSDRLAALGGSCQVDSRPGRGTTVAGRIGSGVPQAGNAGGAPPPANAGGIPLAGRMG
jgi:signal transduction histidine kinase